MVQLLVGIYPVFLISLSAGRNVDHLVDDGYKRPDFDMLT
jgi:hypothetical protein